MIEEERPSKVTTRGDLLDLAKFEIARSAVTFDLPRSYELTKAFLRFIWRKDVPNEEALADLVGLRGGGRG